MEKNDTMQKPFSAFLHYLINIEKVCTQAEIGNKVGYTQASISAISLGKINGKESKRRAIAEHLGYKYEEFLDIGLQIIAGTFDGLVGATPKNTIQSPAKHEVPQTKIKTDLEVQIEKNHQELLGRFINKELALKVNQLLVKLETLESDDGLKAALEWAKYRVHEAEKKKGLNNLANGTD